MKPTIFRLAGIGMRSFSIALLTLFTGMLTGVQADETCQSPYMAKIVGQEDFVYVWTLGVEGLGDGQDKLVTVDVNPNSSKYGQVIEEVDPDFWTGGLGVIFPFIKLPLAI